MRHHTSPWRFAPGDTAYVRGWHQSYAVTILCQLQNYGWPHYIVADVNGGEHRLSQLELSSKPIHSK